MTLPPPLSLASLVRAGAQPGFLEGEVLAAAGRDSAAPHGFQLSALSRVSRAHARTQATFLPDACAGRGVTRGGLAFTST